MLFVFSFITWHLWTDLIEVVHNAGRYTREFQE